MEGGRRGGGSWEESRGDILVGCHLILPPSLPLVLSLSRTFIQAGLRCAGVVPQWMQVFHKHGPCASPSEGLKIKAALLGLVLLSRSPGI